MTRLAWKNLLHDKVRLAVTLTGIVFALVLLSIQFGIFLGFLDTSANIVAHNQADLWLAAPGIPHVNGGSPFPEKRRLKALAIPGVVQATNYSVGFVNWKLPAGSQESVQIVGFDLDSGLGAPWNIVAGSVADLRGEDTILIDDLYKEKLGVSKIGETVEIFGRRARIVGFTHGIRSFTTSPYIFTNFKNAQNYMRLEADETVFVLVKAAPGADLVAIRQALAREIPSVDVFSNQEMLEKTRTYWVFGTGAGGTTLMGAVLGLLVGTVVVAQTIYSATIDHIREFGTLKAMGATNSTIYRVILIQATLAAVMGYSIGISIALLISQGSLDGAVPILLPLPVAGGIFALTVVMCAAASLLSIRKATTIDPAMVFRG